MSGSNMVFALSKAQMENNVIGLSMEIQLEARDLPNLDFASLSDPLAVLDMRVGNEWKEFGERYLNNDKSTDHNRELNIGEH
jgi:hypothetical protein